MSPDLPPALFSRSELSGEREKKAGLLQYPHSATLGKKCDTVKTAFVIAVFAACACVVPFFLIEMKLSDQRRESVLFITLWQCRELKIRYYFSCLSCR